MKSTPRLIGVLGATAAFAALLLTAAPAVAAPSLSAQLSDKQAQATQVQGQITRLNTKVELAAEAYNAAGDKLAKIDRNVARNQAKLERLQKRQNVLDRRLSTRALNMYRSGPTGMLDVVFGSTSFQEFADNWQLMTQMSQDDAGLVSDVKAVKSDTEAARRVLRKSQAAAAVQLRQRRRQKALVASELAKRKALLASVTADIKHIMAQQAAQALAEARARAAALASDGSAFMLADSSLPHPTIPAHGTVVDYARSRLGLPYVWGASGPDTFDCSGLALWCYAKVGISLPHYSGAQIDVGQRVSRADLQPGDLVFFGSPIHHVGIYIGGGQMIEAPYSGASVRISSAFRDDYAGASRP